MSSKRPLEQPSPADQPVTKLANSTSSKLPSNLDANSTSSTANSSRDTSSAAITSRTIVGSSNTNGTTAAAKTNGFKSRPAVTASTTHPHRPKIRKVNGKWLLPDCSMEEVSQARKFLKQEGYIAFLNKYLPDNPKGSDLLYVICQLGFFSFSFSGDLDDEKNLMAIIRLLQKAMNKIVDMRTRLDNFNTLQDAIDAIQKAQKIIVVTGAGISTSLGIPDFRSSKGIYNQVQSLGLTDPQQVFDLVQFDEDPEIFYSVAHMVLPPTDAFTPLHAFIKLLQDKGKLLRNYTQNIDNLEGHVGLSPSKYIQCHGSFARATCRTCKFNVDGSKIFRYIREKELPLCPHCFDKRKKIMDKNPNYQPQSYGVMKPDITFFKEDLPSRFHENFKKDAQECDLLLCIGTSLKVSPVSSIVKKVGDHVPQVLINKDLIEHCEFDVSLLGYCDQVATYLCDKLGWELTHERISRIREEGLHLEVLDERVGVLEVFDNKQYLDFKAKEKERAAAATAAATSLEY